MKDWLALFSERKISGATALLLLIGLFRFLGGLVAQAIIAFRFGATRITDAYFVSLILPQVVGDFLVGGAIFVALMPVFIDYRNKKGDEEAWRIASVFITVATVFLLVCSLIYLLGAPLFIHLIAPGFDTSAQAIAVTMARILSPLFLFLGLSLVAASILQSYRRFAASALATLAFPCGIIFGCAFLYPALKSYSLPVGALIGAFIQCALQWFILRGKRFRFSFDLSHPAVKKLFKMTGLIALAVILVGFVSLLQRFLASRGEGLVAALNYAQYLGKLPLLFFIAPFVMAIYPSLSALFSSDKREEFSKISSLAIRIINYLAIPLTFLLIIFRVDIIGIILMRGQFGLEALNLTEEALLYLAPGFCAFANTLILIRTFFARHDALTNVYVTAVAVGCAVPLNFILFAKMGIGGLALASSIMYFIMLGGFIYCYNKKIAYLNFREIVTSVIKTLIASSIMTVVAIVVGRYLSSLSFPSMLIQRCVTVGVASVAGIIVFFILTLLFKMEEARRILAFIPLVRNYVGEKS